VVCQHTTPAAVAACPRSQPKRSRRSPSPSSRTPLPCSAGSASPGQRWPGGDSDSSVGFGPNCRRSPARRSRHGTRQRVQPPRALDLGARVIAVYIAPACGPCRSKPSGHRRLRVVDQVRPPPTRESKENKRGDQDHDGHVQLACGRRTRGAASGGPARRKARHGAHQPRGAPLAPAATHPSPTGRRESSPLSGTCFCPTRIATPTPNGCAAATCWSRRRLAKARRTRRPTSWREPVRSLVPHRANGPRQIFQQR